MAESGQQKNLNKITIDVQKKNTDACVRAILFSLKMFYSKIIKHNGTVCNLIIHE